MGMSFSVIGYKPFDEKTLKMKAVLEACDEAQIDAPDEVWAFFGWVRPTEQYGMRVEIPKSCYTVETVDTVERYIVSLTHSYLVKNGINKVGFELSY